MASKDLYSNISQAVAVVPAVLTATNTSAGIDLAGFESAAVLINTGAIAGAGVFNVTLEESDASGSGFTAVPASKIQGTLPTPLAASTVYKLGYLGDKRYIRTVLTLASGTSIVAGAVVLKGNARSKPSA
ncbi:hypothetical protein E5S70_37840 [Ensifer adhaerens]|uniref:hypothetical protein n=1 Tax=Ensifer canadensis TaxID=555315 RepID=UPI00149081F9|nr:hypothetical protein [Ensifer canadensis]NOV21662.1 hypothetical protein [Ensifer canadensis]